MEAQGKEHITVAETLTGDSESVLKKYQHIYVGKESLWELVKYELITLFFGPIPGAAGFFLRKLFYKKLFARIGSGAILGPHLTLRCPGQIFIGDNFIVDGNSVLDAKGADSRIELGNSVFLGSNSIFSCASASIKVGDNVSIGPHSYIRASRGDVSIGSYVSIGAHSVIISGSPDYKRLDIPMMKQDGPARGIRIGDDVWMGVGVRIIDGIKIGNGCVVAAGSVVSKNVPDFAIVGGVPAIKIGKRKTD